jgi:hypothetical protein
MFIPQQVLRGLYQTLTVALLAASAGLLPSGLLLRGRAQ